ncbi:UV DNA damage repair endonuclease UvsE [Ruminiclostridium josui]|uniref:UV DNA damage repair endonuclease UvsE n=1 Tax=Ruminiclostridium josui TaxID=1499 RepID=UPI000467998A|nr:UV DNA damage repair endonuclease UvsE [Ruminiclostridium josui]
MIFRLGFVAMTLELENCSPSGTVTYTVYNKIKDEAGKRAKLDRVAKSNINNTLRILKNSLALNIKVYRLTSKLIPLATHGDLKDWDYVSDFHEEFQRLGEYIIKNNFRVSAHPDHFTILNPIKPEILESSIRDLDYHVKLFEAMGLYDYKYKLVLHVGGLYGDKESAIDRFKENFLKLPHRISKRIILENDDKCFTAADVLGICEDLKIPMVLDVHHHRCVNNGEELGDLLERIFNTWNFEPDPPKVHFSSPKSEKEFRSHADYVDLAEFMEFLHISKKIDRDTDIMLEAKMKDRALQRLSAELLEMPEIERLDKATFRM